MRRSYADDEREKAEKSGQGLGGQNEVSGGLMMEVRRVTAAGETGTPGPRESCPPC